MNWKFILWFAGMFFAGKLFYSIFGIQYWITKNCAEKLYRMLQYETSLWYPEPCRRYLKKLKRTQVILFVVVTALVLCFVPLIGVLGYFAGYFIAFIFSLGKTGTNEANLGESCEILHKFAKDGCDASFTEALFSAAAKLMKNPYMNA